METTNIKWSVKDIVVGKTLLVIPAACIMAWALSLVYVYLIDPILYNVITDGGLYYTIMQVFGVVCVAAGAVLGVLALLFIYNKRLEGMVDPEVASEWYHRERTFKWHMLFSVVIGFAATLAVWGVLATALGDLTERTNGDTSDYLLSFVLTVAMIAAPFFIVKGARKLNLYMVKVTGTNAALIEDVRRGVYDDRIPNGLTQEDIIGVLENAGAYNVTVAAMLHVAAVILKKVGKFLLKVFGISALIGVILGLICGKAIEGEMDDMVQRTKAAMDAADRENKIYAENRKAEEAMRRQKWKDAADAKKNARFMYDQARKAYAYNPNTYETTRRGNLAKQAIFDWLDAEKNKHK